MDGLGIILIVDESARCRQFEGLYSNLPDLITSINFHSRYKANNQPKNVTGWFLLGGIPQEHFTYSIKLTRDGRNYCTRTITVTQIAERGVMFTCTCSFKRAETSSVECQHSMDIKKKYSAVLEGKRPFDHPDAPSQDSTW